MSHIDQKDLQIGDKNSEVDQHCFLWGSIYSKSEKNLLFLMNR
jgi:hypothetical protein